MIDVLLRAAPRAALFLLSLSLSLPVAAQGRRLVFVDDDDPSAEFHRIDDALAQAQPGAVVYVRAGSYGPDEHLVIDGRSLQVFGEPGTLVDVRGSLTIANIASDQRVSVVGLTLRGTNPSAASQVLHVRDSVGAVWIEDAVVRSAPSGAVPQAAVHVDSSQQVLFVRTTVRSQTLLGTPVDGMPGIEATASSLHVFDASIQGGPAGFDDTAATAEGGPGVRLDGASHLFLSGTSVVGGPGSAGTSGAGCADGGPGGPAIDLIGTGPTVLHEATSLTGGPGGQPVGIGTCSPGAIGPPTRGGGTVVVIPAAATRSFVATPAVVQVGQPLELRFRAAPGDMAFLVAGPDTRLLFLPNLLGTLAVSAPVLVLPMGVVPPSGQLTSTVSVGFASDVRSMKLQAAFVDATSTYVDLSSPSSLLVLLETPRDRFGDRAPR